MLLIYFKMGAREGSLLSKIDFMLLKSVFGLIQWRADFWIIKWKNLVATRGSHTFRESKINSTFSSLLAHITQPENLDNHFTPATSFTGMSDDWGSEASRHLGDVKQTQMSISDQTTSKFDNNSSLALTGAYLCVYSRRNFFISRSTRPAAPQLMLHTGTTLHPSLLTSGFYRFSTSPTPLLID